MRNQKANQIKCNHRERISFKEKVAFGLGGASENLASNLVGVLIMPIFSIGLGVNAFLVGLAMSLPRLWDAFTDPIMGNISDNTHSRFGRRKPYIFIGAVLTGLFFALIWIAPASLSKWGLFWYLVVVLISYFTSFTIFGVPFNALGYEMTNDYDERISIMSYKMFIMSVVGIMFIPFAYKMCFISYLGNNELEGVKIIGIIFGAMMILFGIAPVLFCKERAAKSDSGRENLSLFQAIKFTCQNKAFMILCIAMFLAFMGFLLAYPLLVYINIAYIVPGDKETAATNFGYVAFIYGVFSFVSVPMVNFIAHRLGKKKSLIIGLIMVLIGFVGTWFYFTPNYPHLQVLYGIIASPGMSFLWILTQSSIADVCDIDELKTGRRREGVYGAVYSWLLKLSLSISLMLNGLIVSLSGFDSEILIQSSRTIITLRLIFVFLPAMFIGLAIYLTSIYPVTREAVKEVQQQLYNKTKHTTPTTKELDLS